MTNKILKPGFTDHRTAELIAKIKTVVKSFAVAEGMTYCNVIGALETVKLDLYMESCDE
jgi:hypothetical protein